MAFAADTVFAAAAIAALAPAGYQRTFTNLNASQLYDPSTMIYMGYQSITKYDASMCTGICDNTTGCVGVNLYYERDPTLNPAASCLDPTAMTTIKCTLWGSPVSPDYATNFGQWREQFHVVIAGSNGYFKLPVNACSAISSAYHGNGYSWPTGRVDWKAYGSMTAAMPTVMPTAAAVRPTAAPAAAGFRTEVGAGKATGW